MAGHVIKIILDNTHPPVWRRVIVPEKITFADLHEIIQILFGWDDYHLHDFQIPSKRHASFLKAKGDNFAEDSGGLLSHCEYGENRVLLNA